MAAILPAPDAKVDGWHVSPVIDLGAYAFSWLWVLVPMLLVGSSRADYLYLFIAIVGFNFAHRHVTFPYVYGDGQVFRRHPFKFTVLPLLFLALFAITPWLWNVNRPIVQGLAFVAFLWNIWHVYMQKYGILRMYNAKSGLPPADRTPGWVDRLLILCWVPLYFAWLGPKHQALIQRSFRSGRRQMDPILDWCAANHFWLVPLTATLVVAAVLLFLRGEWRANRMRNRPRLLMALGTTCLSAAVLIFDPVKVLLAFAFSHSLEYCVFVWAYQRKRYHQPLEHKPLLGRMLRFPLLYYTLVIGGCAAIYIVLKFWGWYIAPESARIVLFGERGGTWIFWWAIYQSMIHFYFDGFLWKMRLPAVRAHL